MLACCNHRQQDTGHEGERRIDRTILAIDSVVINDDNLSDDYCLMLVDSCIVFADVTQNDLHFYNIPDGAFNSRRLGYGNGPKELVGMMYAYPLRNSDGEIIIVDSSIGQYSYFPDTDSLVYKGRIDFNWGKGVDNRYDDISNYNVMEMSDFAINFARQDSSILLPLSIVNRQFKEINADRYENGHIFARMDPNTMKVGKPFGKFPEMFKSTPLPQFEFFDFAVDNATGEIIYNFAPDSVIYVANHDGVPVRTFGFDVPGANRKYTAGYDTELPVFYKDMETVSVNTGLYYDETEQILFRTTMVDFASGKIVLQGYDKDGNLILEEVMPKYFKMLGKYNGKYYGARFLPSEDGENISFPVYSFYITKK